MDNLLAVAPAHCIASTYCTHVGAEIDLLLERAVRPWMSKKKNAPRPQFEQML
ncbi:MAG: hypothetical protein ORN28_02920 [Rhodoferax sp.]|nr:hypothetical protein [Rhodoferax sp.]